MYIFLKLTVKTRWTGFSIIRMPQCHQVVPKLPQTHSLHKGPGGFCGRQAGNSTWKNTAVSETLKKYISSVTLELQVVCLCFRDSFLKLYGGCEGKHKIVWRYEFWFYSLIHCHANMHSFHKHPQLNTRPLTVVSTQVTIRSGKPWDRDIQWKLAVMGT